MRRLFTLAMTWSTTGSINKASWPKIKPVYTASLLQAAAMVNLPVHQTSLDEVNGFQAQGADHRHLRLGPLLDDRSPTQFLTVGALKNSGCECSCCVDGLGIPALSASANKLPRHIWGHLAF